MDIAYGMRGCACLLGSRFIKTDAHKMEVAVRPPMAVTNAVSWRTEVSDAGT
jgi:AP-1 complex subunit mu